MLAGPVLDQEILLTADLDMALIPRARYDFDPVGHYARPDIFRLHVDTTDRRAVRTSDSPSASPSADSPTTSLGHRP
ncbi:hypothetical protein GCM10010185_27100 [Saccharothrix coeruleofusca]|uniref:Carbon-nitrogen hydrolase n=1 Tax=Saccharothrix coeruleofusca TaxID=33919 RepID=A0A918EE44_9PSEU|nr:hypothetical protein GCM10010185_27100 [Saccharothrix coeruleofusca]